MHRKILWKWFLILSIQNEARGSERLLGVWETGFFFFLFVFWQELGWHQEKLYTCEKLGESLFFLFCQVDSWRKERFKQKSPSAGTPLMSGKHRGCSQHIWHLNPCRSWDAIQLSCLHWALGDSEKACPPSAHQPRSWHEGLQRAPFFPYDPISSSVESSKLDYLLPPNA